MRLLACRSQHRQIGKYRPKSMVKSSNHNDKQKFLINLSDRTFCNALGLDYSPAARARDDSPVENNGPHTDLTSVLKPKLTDDN